MNPALGTLAAGRAARAVGGEQAAEPRLDVGLPVEAGVGRLDELIERVGQLLVEAGLVGEAREVAHQRGQLVMLIAGQVGAQLEVRGYRRARSGPRAMAFRLRPGEHQNAADDDEHEHAWPVPQPASASVHRRRLSRRRQACPGKDRAPAVIVGTLAGLNRGSPASAGRLGRRGVRLSPTLGKRAASGVARVSSPAPSGDSVMRSSSHAPAALSIAPE